MKKILNNTIKILFPLLLGAVILYWIYRDFDFSQLSLGLRNMNWWWFAVSLFFGILSHAIRGWRWRLTLAPLGYIPRNDVCVYSIFIAYAANLIVPRVGEVSRCVVLDRFEKVPFAQSLGTVVSERLIDTLMVVIITMVAVLLQWPVFTQFIANAFGASEDVGNSGQFNENIIILSVSLVAILLLLLFLMRKMSLWSKLKSFIARFWEGMSTLAKMKNLPLFIFETVGIWFCYFMQFYLCFFCFSFSSSLSLFAALLLFVGGSIAVVVPTPNGAGPWHFAIMSFMMLYGVCEGDAQLFALVVHTSQTLLIALLGIYAWIMLQFIRRKIVC